MTCSCADPDQHHSRVMTSEYGEKKPHVSHLVAVCPVLVLGPVGGVAEGLGAAGELAHVGFLPGVGPQVGLQVLQPAVRLPATLKLTNKITTVIKKSINTIKLIRKSIK